MELTYSDRINAMAKHTLFHVIIIHHRHIIGDMAMMDNEELGRMINRCVHPEDREDFMKGLPVWSVVNGHISYKLTRK